MFYFVFCLIPPRKKGSEQEACMTCINSTAVLYL